MGRQDSSIYHIFFFLFWQRFDLDIVAGRSVGRIGYRFGDGSASRIADGTVVGRTDRISVGIADRSADGSTDSIADGRSERITIVSADMNTDRISEESAESIAESINIMAVNEWIDYRTVDRIGYGRA